MIQRIQSLWLVLAAIFAFLTIEFPFYSGNILENELLVLRKMTALGLSGSTETDKTEINLLSLFLAAATVIMSLIAIFLFNNRKTQLKLTITAMLIGLLNLVYLFILTQDFSKGTLSLTSVLAFLPPVFLFLACRAIYKDEKMVRSMDRLR